MRLPIRISAIRGLISRKETKPTVPLPELLAELGDPFKEALLSMYRGEPQVGVDGTKHPLDPSVKISPEEGMWLYQVCRESEPQRTLEIGLAYGFSTIFFLAALAKSNSGHHTAIDPYNRSGYGGIGLTIPKRLAGADKFRIIELTSEQAAVELERENQQYQVIFIDGGHLFEQALADFYLYTKFCKIGGLMILDDMWMSSIRTVASFIRTNRKDFSELPTSIQNICVFRKAGRDEREWRHFRTFSVGEDQPRQ